MFVFSAPIFFFLSMCLYSSTSLIFTSVDADFALKPCVDRLSTKSQHSRVFLAIAHFFFHFCISTISIRIIWIIYYYLFSHVYLTSLGRAIDGDGGGAGGARPLLTRPPSTSSVGSVTRGMSEVTNECPFNGPLNQRCGSISHVQ